MLVICNSHLHELDSREGEMSDREKYTPEQPTSDAEEVSPEADTEKLSLGELGAVFGGWHPAPPPLDPPSDPIRPMAHK